MLIQVNGFTDTLESIDHGNYISVLKAEEGTIYNLEVTKEGYKKIKAETKVPLKSNIEGVDKSLLQEVTEDGFPVYNYAIQIRYFC